MMRIYNNAIVNMQQVESDIQDVRYKCSKVKDE